MDDIDTVWWRRCLDRHASAQVPAYAVLAEALARGCAAGVAAIGLTGPQGAGKSTLVEYLVQAFSAAGRRPVALALDDYYLGHAARAALATSRHPLFATRGVPGTHEVSRLHDDLRTLAAGGTCLTPVFDKGRDDRRPMSEWRRLGPGADLVILEGWCVGVPPADPDEDLATPLNALEAQADADGRWRRAVDGELAGRYAALYAALDALVLLAPPDFDASRRWRAQQELALPAAQRMSAEALAQFMSHYERLALRALRVLSGSADAVVHLDAQHRVYGVDVRRAFAACAAFRVDSC